MACGHFHVLKQLVCQLVMSLVGYPYVRVVLTWGPFFLLYTKLLPWNVMFYVIIKILILPINVSLDNMHNFALYLQPHDKAFVIIKRH